MEAAAELQCLLQGSPAVPGPIDVKAEDQEHFVPRTKESVGYIVCGIVFNDQNEILMMQEAKMSCYGLWYLPAGRMEINEDINEAVQREITEETGIEFTPTTLLSVEVASGSWYRFTFTGKVTGGSLKTIEQKDKESLQARWCSLEVIKSGRKGFPLRASDILPLINLAVQHRSSPDPHADLLPSPTPHTKLLLRTVFIHKNHDSSEVNLLLGKKPHPHIPVGQIAFGDFSLQSTLQRVAKAIFGHSKLHPKIWGTLALEHSGKPAKVHDGLCLSILITIETADCLLPVVSDSKYEWCNLNGDLQKDILNKCQPGKLVPVLLLR